MLTINPQFIKDSKGKKSLVVLSAKEFESIMEELDAIEDVRLYDEAKANDTGERILFSEYVKNRKEKNV